MEEELERELQALMDSALEERDAEEKDEEDLDNNDDGINNKNEDDKSDDIDNEDEDENLNKDDKGDSGEDKETKDDLVDKFEPIELEGAHGIKFKIESQAELLAFARKGALPDKPSNKPSIIEEMVSQGRLTKDELTILIDAKNGDKNALAKLAEISKIDVLDIENENASKYVPTFEARVQSEIENVATEILKDVKHAEEFKSNLQSTPEDFINEISGSAELVSAFSSHVKSGLAQRIIPLATKSQVLNGGTFLENYSKIGRELSSSNPTKPTETKPAESERQISEREEKMRNRATAGGRSEGSKKTGTSAEDIWGMSDEEFAKLDLSKIKD